jgi:hypothetical protein
MGTDFYLSVFHVRKHAHENCVQITSHFNNENLPLVSKRYAKRKIFKPRIHSLLDKQSAYLNHKQIRRSLETSGTKSYISGSQSGGGGGQPLKGGVRDIQVGGDTTRIYQILTRNWAQITLFSYM